ncbi:signal peptidase II [Bifidobacterium bombi]|nr:signal peptidase II [Bifidobacterium bombi]
MGRLCMRVAVLVCVSVVLLAVDQATKLWALTALRSGKIIEIVPGVLALMLVRNPGASLGMGSGYTWLISCLAIVACVLLVVLALAARSLQWTVVLSMGFAGALGNLIDRCVYATGFLDGRVVDFLDYGWSVGNVADIILMVAGVCIVVMLLREVPFRSSGDAKSVDDADRARSGAV